MKLLLVFFLLISNVPEMDNVRKYYVEAATSKESAAYFYELFEGIDTGHENGTLVAYKAASVVLMAKYERNLFTKTKYFNRGTDMLDAAIKKHPDNYEARLIRLNIQDNVPWITGYTSEIKEDKAFLIKNYINQPEGLKTFTKKYVKQSSAFTDKEKKAFN
ncbi:hypothetical protein [Flavobacterium sp. MK4S-17]|uniref:hypothetical protein n=1 Tax=Flavobacterium sp. MK4S-17 TaxID=2543737 RepID=UPI001359D4A9|nr:hypothetical protein [Flavobacterium sp. MK4S-17]